eukprot:336308-Prorocentrum_minimum.AAC.1
MKTEHCLTLTEPVRRMHEEFYADPFRQARCLMTLTCPAAKDPLYQSEYPGTSNVLLLTEGLYDEWFQVSPHTRGPEPAYPGTRARVPGDPSPRTRRPEPAYPGHGFDFCLDDSPPLRNTPLRRGPACTPHPAGSGAGPERS